MKTMTIPMRKAIPYYRVSTDRQGLSGLGLKAQQDSVRLFAKVNDLVLLHEFTEVESGRKNKRPVLGQALQACRRQKAILLIAKLDRLGRNALFILTLFESQVEFIAVDNPHANKFVVHLLAAFAEHERDQISERTKAALQSAKRRGVELGKNGKYILSKHNRRMANGFARKMRPIIHSLREDGFSTIRQLTDELNKRKIAPYSGNDARWHTTSVFNLLKRIQALTTKIPLQ